MTPRPGSRLGPVLGVALLFALQLVFALVFILDILGSTGEFLGLSPGWRGRELIEIGAALGLILGLVLGAAALHRALRQRNLARDSLRRASGAFQDLLAERFGDWGLTEAERDVSLFLIKGMSTAEIAALRDTSEGTIKSQTNAIYRKAGVAGRQQLLSLFIEDMMGSPERSRPEAGEVRQATAAKAPY